MSRAPKNASAAPRPRPQAAVQTSPHRSAEPARHDASPAFPFSRTVEDDELRDLSGYGWGI